MIRTRKPAGELRPRAEERIGAKRRKPAAAAAGAGAAADAQRIMHELEVHQTELEIQNEELRAARAENEAALVRYTELFDFAPIGYATLSSDGIVRDLNHAGARVLGRSKARVIGSPFAAFVAASDLHLFQVLLQRAADSDAPPSCELELSVGGHAVQVRFTATAVAREERTILVAFEDVSERVAREAQLARTEQALRESNQRKDEFLAMLSHELRNPLGPISGSLFILDRVDPDSQQALNARAIIDRQVAHLTRLIGDLLDVTRITRGKVELQREDVELAGLVRRTLDDHRPGFETRGLRLEDRLDGGPFWLRADPARLVQVVSNLLGNAEKFTPRGGIVTVSLEVRGPEVVLRVRDTGVGIAPELIGGMFEPFAQGPQTMDRSRGGLGLGLAMVKGLIELHGGTVQLSSEGVGRGTEVVVSLPLAAAPAEAAVPAERATVAAHRVLVIEDNVDAAMCLYDGLSMMGHEVRIAHRGATGLDVARTFRPDVVLCDLGLPEMDGYEVAAAFRADPALRGAHLIALSGYARPEDRQHAIEAGFDHHVAKPPAFGELDRLIASASRPDDPRVGASLASSARRRPPASASGHAAASSAGTPPAACESSPSRRSSGAARPARRRSTAG